MIDKVAARLPSWKAKFLDRHGRLTLVNSVLSSIPVHFLSGGHCLVMWPKAARPKPLGGLGILDLQRFGRALRLRWLWYEWVDPNRPWVETPPCDLTDKALFRASTIVTIGRGDKVSFWHSSWLNGRAPIDIAPNLYPLAWRKNQKVKDDLLHMNWTRGLWRMEYVQ
jgi:hypothetical protein